MKFKYFHFHQGITKSLVESQISEMPLQDGINKIILKNDHPVTCSLVEVSMFDQRVFWAFRGTRKYPSPMISYADAQQIGMEETTDITVVLEKKGELCKIITAYPGSGSPKEPSTATPQEYEECVEFWSNHALVPEDDNVFRAHSMDVIPEWVKAAYQAAAV